MRLINREISSYLVPLIMSARENHFVTYADQPLVAGQQGYILPSKAAGLKTRALVLVDASGKPYSRLQERSLESGITMGGA